MTLQDLSVDLWDEVGEYASPYIIDDLLTATEVYSERVGEKWEVECVAVDMDSSTLSDDIRGWRLTRNEEQVVGGCLRDLAYWWNGYMEAKREAQ